MVAIVESIRKLVRPVTLFALVGAIIYVAVVDVGGKEGLAVLLAVGGPVVGFWFKERSDERVTSP